MTTMGRRYWAIAEGFIPGESTGPAPFMTSHETVCILNTGDTDANVEITIFFQDRGPVGPYRFVVPAQRTKHLLFNDLNDPAPIPRNTPYASTLVSIRDRPRTPSCQRSPTLAPNDRSARRDPDSARNLPTARRCGVCGRSGRAPRVGLPGAGGGDQDRSHQCNGFRPGPDREVLPRRARLRDRTARARG